MSGFEERVREDRDYLYRVIGRSEMFNFGSEKLYYYSYKNRNYIFFFGRKLESNYIEFLSSKFGAFILLIISNNFYNPINLNK